MEHAGNESYISLLIISNVVAILQLLAALKWPAIARFSFFFLFAWASWTNWITSQHTPDVYLEYAALAWSSLYKQFINGWFSEHIQFAVGCVASCQALIAVAILLKGWVFRVGCIGGIVFLLAILPLGIGSGFPCTAIMAASLLVLLWKYNNNYLWEKKANQKTKKEIRVMGEL